MKSLLVAVTCALMATGAHAQSQNNTNENTAVATTSTFVTNTRGTRYPVNPSNAPSIATANNCAQGGSGGVSLTDISISFGGTRGDKDCVAQNAAQMALALAERGMIPPAAVVGVACENTYFRKGMNAAGSPCPQDARRATSQPRSQRVQYTKCERNSSGQLTVRVRANGDQSVAVAQCRRDLSVG